MKSLKLMLTIIGFLTLIACGGNASTSSSSDTVTGVATAEQISVVTAK